MKKLLSACFIAAALFITANANAQEQKTTFGLKIGIGISNMTGDGESGDAKVGFTGGVTLDNNLTPNWYMFTGLEYAVKGMKDSGVTLGLSYLQLPVHFGYKLQMQNNTKIVFHAGPYLAYAIDGKWKMGGVSIDAFGDAMSNSTSGVVKFKRLDAGIGFGVGGEFGKICFGAGYDFGLVNVYDGNLNSSIKNLNGYITTGYKF